MLNGLAIGIVVALFPPCKFLSYPPARPITAMATTNTVSHASGYAKSPADQISTNFALGSHLSMFKKTSPVPTSAPYWKSASARSPPDDGQNAGRPTYIYKPRGSVGREGRLRVPKLSRIHLTLASSWRGSLAATARPDRSKNSPVSGAAESL